MGGKCHEVTSQWSYFGRQVTCPHKFCQDCSSEVNEKNAKLRSGAAEFLKFHEILILVPKLSKLSVH